MLLYNNAVEIDLGVSLIGTLIYFGVIIFLIASQWIMFKKAGESGWKCLIPIYNIYILCKIARRPKLFWKYMVSSILVFVFACVSIGGIIATAGVGMTTGELSGSSVGVFLIGILLMLISLLVLGIIVCILYFNLAKAFGQGALFGIGMIFLAPIFMAIIAFSRSIQYVGYYEQPMRNMGPSGPNYYGNSQNPYGYNNQPPYGGQSPNPYNPNPYNQNPYNQNPYNGQSPYSGQNPYNGQSQFGFNQQDPNNRNNY